MAQQTVSTSRSRALLWVAGFAALAAVGTHGYLLSEHLKLHYGAGDPGSLCNISSVFNCSTASASKYSEFLGVPVALWGLLANLVLALLVGWHAMVDDDRKSASSRNLLFVSGFIFIVSIVMGSISAIALGALCPACLVTYVLSAIAFLALWMGRERAPTSPLAAGFKFSDAKPVLILAAVAFFAGFVANDQSRKSYQSQDLGPMVRGMVADWKSAPQTSLALVEPLSMGPPADQAKMTVVEFADFRCIHCKHAAPVFKAFARSHPDVRFEFQPWPLDGECNTQIQAANGASCLLARAAYCAIKKGDGWKAHEYIFAQEIFPNLQAVEAGLDGIAKAAGVDTKEFATCAQSDEAKEVVRKQAQVGTALNLKGTPTVYANGKLLGGGQLLPVLSEAYRSLP